MSTTQLIVLPKIESLIKLLFKDADAKMVGSLFSENFSFDGDT